MPKPTPPMALQPRRNSAAADATCNAREAAGAEEGAACGGAAAEIAIGAVDVPTNAAVLKRKYAQRLPLPRKFRPSSPFPW